MGRKRSKKESTSPGVSTRLENRKRYRKFNDCIENSSNASTDSMSMDTNGATSQDESTACDSQHWPNYSTTMIPEFDPSNENHRIDMWLCKVNECAEKYGWDEEHTIRYALSKLGGCGKVWLQSQASVLNSWERWQDLLYKAFPYNTNYAELLSVMLDRRLKYDEELEEYYQDKMALLYACDISGERAVDCITHGIDDFSIRAIATAAQCQEPEDLLNLLKDIHYEQKDIRNRWCI